ncbi:MAG: hypothetical protein FD174_2829 [Geobacteraceae bacterium]|nr:MAG: hypothetical protein FD174_2829 [Geobacteraceae bacterium]
MRCTRFVPLLLALSLCGTAHAGTPAAGETTGQGSVKAQVQGVQEKLMGDNEIMALILSLQNDPDMQALLNDPAVLNAVSAGDINALTGNPRFMELLNNPKVREIQKRVNQ